MAYEPLVLPTFSGTPNYASSITFMSQTASAIARSAQSFVTDLTALKNTDFSSVGDLPAFNSTVWLGQSTNVLERPTRPTIDVNVDDFLVQLRNLAAPVAPTETFTYTDPGYSSAMRDAMIEKLLTDLVNGGYGIDTADEISLWNRVRDREEMVAQANADEVRRQASATGFQLPQGAMYIAMQKARQEHMAKISSANRDIGLKRADLYVDNRRQVIAQVLATEDQSITLYNAIQNRTLQFAQVKVQMSIALFEAGVRLFDTRIRGLNAQIQSILEAARAELGVYTADVQAYAAFVNAVASGAQIDIANSRNILTRDIAAHTARADVIRMRLQQLGMTVENSKSINTFGAEFFRTGLGATLNGINGLAVQTSEV